MMQNMKILKYYFMYTKCNRFHHAKSVQTKCTLEFPTEFPEDAEIPC